MLYSLYLVVPPNTPISAPISGTLANINDIFIYRASVFLPPGCQGAVFWSLFDYENRLAPLPSGYINISENFSVNKILVGPPRRIRLVAYNEAIDYPHTILFTADIGDPKYAK